MKVKKEDLVDEKQIVLFITNCMDLRNIKKIAF